MEADVGFYFVLILRDSFFKTYSLMSFALEGSGAIREVLMIWIYSRST